MEQLEDVIERLRKLDRWRRDAAHLREEGCATLLASLSPKGSAPNSWPELKDDQILEKAEVLKALLASHGGGDSAAVSKLTDALEAVPRTKALQDNPDRVPVLRAAKALCALAVSPNSAFSASVMYFM